MSNTDYINVILEILQINVFSHLFVPAPFMDSSSCIKKQNVDIETLHTLHNKYTLFSTDILPSLQHYLEMIGTYLNVTGLLKMNKNNLAYQLDNYILKNISQPINVEMLCKEFSLSKD